MDEVDETLSFSDLQQFSMPRFSTLGKADSIVFQDVEFPGPLPNPFANIWPNLYGLTSLNFTGTNADRIGPFRQQLALYDTDTQLEAYLTIVDNANLVSVDISGYTQVLTYVDIRGNSESLDVNLRETTVAMVNISGVQDLTAQKLSTLGTVTSPQTLQVISENGFKVLSLPALTEIAGTLVIENNTALNRLDLGLLGTISSLKITNNTSLRDIVLPKLSVVYTSLDIEGPIDRFVLRELVAAPEY